MPYAIVLVLSTCIRRRKTVRVSSCAVYRNKKPKANEKENTKKKRTKTKTKNKTTDARPCLRIPSYR